MNRDFEFRQLLRAYRSGVITEETFEQEMANLETGTPQSSTRVGVLGKKSGPGSSGSGSTASIQPSAAPARSI